MKKLFPILILAFTTSTFANDIGAKALELVPNGTIQTQKNDEVKVKTTNGTIVEIDFTKKGEFEDASGDLAEKDVFSPGGEHKSLSDIVSELQKQGYQLKGDWSYDKDLLSSWHYEFEAIKDGQEFELKVDAKTGKILKAELDD